MASMRPHRKAISPGGHPIGDGEVQGETIRPEHFRDFLQGENL